MERGLKMNGVPVLNFFELRKRFDPLDLYAHLESFCGFARVHCLPLPVQLTDQETGKRYVARCVTKEFWLKVIRVYSQAADLPAREYFSRIIEEETQAPDEDLEQGLFFTAAEETMILSDDEDSGEERELPAAAAFRKEAEDAEIAEKIEYISRMLGAGADSREVLSLLAVCELAEVRPDKIDASLWRKSSESAGAVREKGTAEYFSYEEEVCLTAGAQAYKFWYHDEATIEEGDRIATVRVTAKGSANQYAAVRIELYSFQRKTLVQTVTLKREEYRYCNVSNGKIIKFLPVVSDSGELCLQREDLADPRITIREKQAEPWVLDIRRVSSFACGESGQGFLLVQDGKINSQFYKPAEDYFRRLRLEMVPMKVVEAVIRDGEYFLLLEDGTVFSEKNSRERVNAASLDQVF